MRAVRADVLWRRALTALLGDDGQAMTEYALAISLLVAVAVALAAATGIGPTIVGHISSQLGKI